MRDRMGAEQCFVVGATEDFEEFREVTGAIDADVAETLPAVGQDECVVVVRTSPRFADEVCNMLGPDAQVVEDEEEAHTVAEAAAQGRPLEA